MASNIDLTRFNMASKLFTGLIFNSSSLPMLVESGLINVYIDELAKVVGKYYKIDKNILTIECEIYNQPNDYGFSQFKKYNE